MAVGGAALFGVGALCYRLGLSKALHDYGKSPYSYFGGSLAVTAVSAYVTSQSRAVVTLKRANPWLVSN